MPLSYAHSQGDGSNRLFDVPCEYLSKAHVTVRVDGTLVPFSWIDTYRLQTSTAPPAQSVVEVRRTTPREDRLVTFTDGSTLVQSDLNTSTLQSFFLTQEAFDQGAASMAVTEDGQFSALQRRITSLADPVNSQDAVTKGWALSAANTNLTAAVAAKDAAVVARQGSETARSGSEVARTAAETARDEARAHRDTASAHRLNAQNAQTGAETARAGAEAAKVGLEAARDTATSKAGEASASAAAAAKSAQDAAIFDPSSYYTKTQTDSRYLSSTSLTPYSTTAQMNTALAGKFDKAGGAVTGDITVDKANAALQVHGDNRQWYIQAYEAGAYLRIVDINANAEAFRIGNDGSLWCRQLGDINSRIENRAAAFADDRRNNAIAQIMPTIAAQGYNAVGAYMFARRGLSGAIPTTGVGTVVGGGELFPANARAVPQTGVSLPGGWMLCGYIDQYSGEPDRGTTLWKRVW